ncbi:methylated-DNA--[protein]-cysteine S-methyltransferase [Desulfobaculum sp. SPO524]|uniref:methylated-DNA--[protein]-cysteine S-methyltransferase n=1 Tax=Desulfobaculum sp. SPO524 TaxID=3378071 RepID=UPI0038554DC4
MTTQTETLTAGPLALTLTWSGALLTGSALSWSETATPSLKLSAAGSAVQRVLANYVLGRSVTWPDLPLAEHKLPAFTRRVLATLRREVPHGHTVTYKELAEMAGSPNSARAVGQVMGRNPWLLLVPCHRVLSTSGLGGYASGEDLKRALLELEGVPAP